MGFRLNKNPTQQPPDALLRPGDSGGANNSASVDTKIVHAYSSGNQKVKGM